MVVDNRTMNNNCDMMTIDNYECDDDKSIICIILIITTIVTIIMTLGYHCI